MKNKIFIALFSFLVVVLSAQVSPQKLLENSKRQNEELFKLVEPYYTDGLYNGKDSVGFRKALRAYRFGINRLNAYDSGTEPDFLEIANEASFLSSNGVSDFTEWQSKGPFGILSDGTKNLHLGRVESAAHNPNYPEVFYLGSNAGGMFKTTDGGENWFNVTDNLGLFNLGITDIELDYDNPNVVYAGTGIEFGDAIGNFRRYGYGILVSYNDGDNWEMLYSIPVTERARVKKIQIVRGLGYNYLFAIVNASDRTASRGHSEVLRFDLDNVEDEPVVIFSSEEEDKLAKIFPHKRKYVMDMAFLPNSPNVMMVTSDGFQGYGEFPHPETGVMTVFEKTIENPEVWITNNSGANNPDWNRLNVPNHLEGFLEITHTSFTSLINVVEVSKDKPQSFFLCSGVKRITQGLNLVYEYDVNSESWFEYGRIPSAAGTEIINNLRHEYFVSQHDWHDQFFAMTKKYSTFELTDDFRIVNSELYSLKHDDARNVYPYINDNNGKPFENILICDDGGLSLLKSPFDDTHPLFSFESLNGKGLSLLQGYGIEAFYDVKESSIIGVGSQDNNTFYFKGQEILHKHGGDNYDLSFRNIDEIIDVRVHNNQSETFRTKFKNGIYGAGSKNYAPSVYKHLPGIAYQPNMIDESGFYIAGAKLIRRNEHVYTSGVPESIVAIPPHPAPGVAEFKSPAIVALESDPFLPNTIYAAVASSKSGFMDREGVSGDELKGLREHCKLVRLRMDPDNNYQIERNFDNMCTEMEATNRPDGFLAWTNVTDIAPSTIHKGQLYVTIGQFGSPFGGNRVYKVNFGEETFCDDVKIEDISFNLSRIPVITVEHRGTRGFDEVFIGNDEGVFYWNEYMVEWLNISKGLPKIPVQDIEVDEKLGKLLISTYGRGVYEANIPEINYDLYAEAFDGDDGTEPTPASEGDLWHSPAIEVIPPTDIFGSNPIPGVANRVRFKVTNRGDVKSNPKAKVHMYFSKASTGMMWDKDWVNRREGGVLIGDELPDSPKEIGFSLEPGESTVLEFEWIPPLPDLLQSDDPRHFCMYGRVIDAPGIDHNEGEYVFNNAKFINSVVWRNVTLSSCVEADGIIRWPSVRFENTLATSVNTDLEVRLDNDNISEVMRSRDLFFQLSSELYSQWEAGGRQMEGCEELLMLTTPIDRIVDLGELPKLVKVFKLNEPTARLKNIKMPSVNTQHVAVNSIVKPQLTFASLTNPFRGKVSIDLVQLQTDDGQIIGGQRFDFECEPEGIAPNSHEKEVREERNSMLNQKKKFGLSPNPTTNSISILNHNQDAQYKLFDSAGKLILVIENYDGGKIDISNYKKGVYVLKEFLSSRNTQNELLIKH